MERNRIFQIIFFLALLVGILFFENGYTFVMIFGAITAIVYACFFGKKEFRVPARWTMGLITLLLIGLYFLVR